MTVVKGGFAQRIHGHLLVNLTGIPFNQTVIKPAEVCVRGNKACIAIGIIPSTEGLVKCEEPRGDIK